MSTRAAPASACLAVLLAGALHGAWALEVPAAKAAKAMAPARAALASASNAISTSAPGATNALDQREIRAQLSPRRYTTLAAEIGAKVSRVGVIEGASFKTGALLIGFDCALQQAQLNKARAAQLASEKVWRANLRLAELHAVGQVELDVSEAEFLKAKAEVAANAAVIGKCTLRAPFAGRVAEQKVREQQYVQPGQPLLDIIDDAQLELEFIVPSKWLSWLKPGLAFEVAIDETGKTYPARVQRIGARVDPVSQSVKLSAAIDGSFRDLIAGMSGRVSFAAPASQ